MFSRREYVRHEGNLRPDLGSVDSPSVKLSIKAAASLVLSSLNLLVSTAGLYLGYSGVSPDLGAAIIWLISPPLLFFTIAYPVTDLLRPVTRKQAIVGDVYSPFQ
jgi:hypothetical protein